MHCMSVSLGLDGAGLGTLLGTPAGHVDARRRGIHRRRRSTRSSRTRSTSTTSRGRRRRAGQRMRPSMTIEASRRQSLPQLNGTGLFVTDGGLETELIFHDGLDLPCFAAFPLLENPDTRARLRRYYDGYLGDRARATTRASSSKPPRGVPTPTGRGQLGYSPEQLDAANRAGGVASPRRSRAVAQADGITVVVSGCVGPRGDGYQPGSAMYAGGRRALPRGADRHVRHHHRRPGHRDRPSPTPRRRSASCAPPRQRAFRRRSPSRSRPTVGCPPASRCMRRSSRWTRRPAPAPRMSWSTAPTPLTSPMHWQPTGRGGEGSSACGRTHP